MMNMAALPELIYGSKSHVQMKKLIEQYVLGARNRHTLKAAYIIRDTLKVLGTASIAPASFGIFYDDLENPTAGGTGHTMNVCRMHTIPFIDQRV